MLTIKEKIDKSEDIKIKKFCPSKDTIKRVKRKVRVEKDFATPTTNKGLISRTILQMWMQGTDNPMEKLD